MAKSTYCALDLSGSVEGVPAGSAIAAETRHGLLCALCRRREKAMSPAAIEGKHDGQGRL